MQMLKIKEKDGSTSKAGWTHKTRNLTSSFLPQQTKLNFIFDKKASVPPLASSFSRQKVLHNNRQIGLARRAPSQPEAPGHKKSLSINICGERTSNLRHGRSATILDLQKISQNVNDKMLGKEAIMPFSRKTSSEMTQKHHKRSITNLAKEVEEKATESCTNFWKARSPKISEMENPYEPPKPSADKIVVNNNINIEIKYLNDKKKDPIAFKSPDIKVFAERFEDEKKPPTQRQKKNLSVELSPKFCPVSPPRDPQLIKNSAAKLHYGPSARDFQIKLQLNFAQNRNSSSKKSFGALAAQKQALHSKMKYNVASAKWKPSNSMSGQKEPEAKRRNLISEFSPHLSPKDVSTNLHKKNATSPDLSQLAGLPKKFYMPSSLSKRKKKSPQQLVKSTRNNAFPSQTTRKLISVITQPSNLVNKQRVSHVASQGSKNVSLQSFCQETNSEIAEINEEEDSAMQLDPKMNDSVVRHDTLPPKARLIESIERACRSSRSVPPTSLHYYHISKALGEGSYAKVYLGFSVLAELPVAIKCYEKANIKSESTLKCILKEVEIMKGLNHPNIVKFIEIFEDEDHIFVVLEHADRGDLLSYVKRNGRLSEQEMTRVLGQILNGLHYLHHNKILHRDIKLDNILLTAQGQIKICDFGVSTRILGKALIHEHIGTPAYLAPEIIEGAGYTGFQVDVWSLGVMAFICVLGVIPFRGEAIADLNRNILQAEPHFPDNHSLSPTMHSVLAGMLKKNPRTRLTVQKTAALLGIKLHAVLPESCALRPSAQIREKISGLGYPSEWVDLTLKKGGINHISALSYLFNLHS